MEGDQVWDLHRELRARVSDWPLEKLEIGVLM